MVDMVRTMLATMVVVAAATLLVVLIPRRARQAGALIGGAAGAGRGFSGLGMGDEPSSSDTMGAPVEAAFRG